VIVTLTLNPSLDRTVSVDALVPGAMLRTSGPLVEPGGKGVNVSRALSANRVPSTAVLPVAGPTGAELGRLLEQDGVATRIVPVSGATRINTTIVESDGTVTKLNEPGAPLTADDLGALRRVIAGLVVEGDWLVVSGSMPPGLDSRELLGMLAPIVASGVRLVVDTSGSALADAVDAADARPCLIKPNLDELSDLVGRPLRSLRDVAEAAEAVRDGGVENVLASLAEDGAVLAHPGGVVVGESTVDRPRSGVGAGDCLLAGFLSRFADDSGADESLLEALAWGAAASALPGTTVPTPALIARQNVQLVWQPDWDRLLADAPPPNNSTPPTKEYQGHV